MLSSLVCSRALSSAAPRVRPAVLLFCGLLTVASLPAVFARSAAAQYTPSAPSTESQLAPPLATAHSGAPQAAEAGGITEEELRRLLVGKDLFLRGGYLDNSLSFNEHGALIGHSPQGSYTLCGIRIDKVRLGKHKLELEGQRFALHFLGALPYEDPAKAADRVNITPKKKVVRITVDRELVVKPKREKEKEKGKLAATPKSASPAATPGQPAEESEAQTEIAAAPPAERPADVKSVTATLSPAHAADVLKKALDNVFAQAFDGRMMAAMPDFWKLYYEAVAAKADYRPKDPAVLRQNMVDKKARLISSIDPASNQYAQDKDVAGMSLYHAVIGVDGKPGEIAVARPIGFGLDESAVASIRNAKFEPAIKDGRPVPVMLDLIVEFRIYSKLTAGAPQKSANQEPEAPSLPGPYSAPH